MPDKTNVSKKVNASVKTSSTSASKETKKSKSTKTVAKTELESSSKKTAVKSKKTEENTKKKSGSKANSKSGSKTIDKTDSIKTDQKNKRSKNENSDFNSIEVEDVYKGMTLHQHILASSDTYIGTTQVNEVPMYIYNDEEEKIEEENINYVAGLFKIFDEILINARDHTVRDKTCKNIRIEIDKETGRISVWNDGNGIPVVIHKKYNIYIPEMIFGNLLTSQNYDVKGKTVGGRNGYGAKLCLKSGTTIPLYNGSIKKIEDIEIGDKLIGDDGNVRNVLDKDTGDGQLFEITQHCYQNQSYIVNENHILCLRMADHKVIFWSNTEKTWNILWLDKQKKGIKMKKIRACENDKIICNECGNELSSNISRHYSRLHPGIEVPKKARKLPTIDAPDTQEVKDGLERMKVFAETIPDDNTLDISVKDYMKLNATTKSRLSGYLGKCVQWEHKNVKLDPYVLGLWLGDGFQRGDGFAINTYADPEILEYIKKWGLKNDLDIKLIGKTDPVYYGVSSLSKCGVAPLKKLLKEYNLIDNKHIPKEYLVNSRDVRLKVLAGLIDSDGYVSREGTRINIAQGMNHKGLAEDIILLARSLGFKVCSQIQNTQWSYLGELKRGLAVVINISGEGVEDIPTKVARKRCCPPLSRDTTGTGYISVKEVESGEYVSLSIDGNKKFVLEDFTVVHNCNIYSKEFEIHTVGADKIKEVDGIIMPDENAKKVEYKQVFRNNMYDVGKPEINTKISQSTKPFTKITFYPDYSRFNMTGLTNDMYGLLVKRCYDIAACTSSSVNIYLNDKEIKCRDFKEYIKLYYPNDVTDPKDKPKITYEKVNPRWEIGVGFNRSVGDRSVSFVNGISTFQGGTHVTYIVNSIIAKVTAYIKKKKEYKDLKIMAATIKQYLTFFVNCVVEDPGFNSQTKEYMNSKMSDWCTCGKSCKDARCELSDDFIKKLCENGLMAEVVTMSEFREMRDLVKTDGNKVGNLRSVKKLLDAEWAGGRNSSKASIFLTEGDSAKSFAINGINVIGSQRYGVFPLRGKLLNVRNATLKQIKDNEEFAHIKKILGLKQGIKYKDVSRLRYGSVIILTDQDPDGSHIKGLIMNMLEYFWPELLQIDGFIKGYNTPIVKAWKRSDTNQKNVKIFYTLTEYEDFKKSTKDYDKLWTDKYYKGLGTSTDKEAVESFNNFDNNLITFQWEHPQNKDDYNKEEAAKLKSELNKKSDKQSNKNKSSKEKNKEDDDDDNKSTGSKSSKISNSKAIDDDEMSNDDDEMYAYLNSNSHMAITKAFDMRKVTLRKSWLMNFRRENLLEYKPHTNVTYSDFIDRDMIFFSNMDNDRSIPSVMDGLKPSQRMIMFCCFKRGRHSKEAKVSQLAGYVSENTDYHHGEASLQGAIIGLAQNYPGSNNINLLKPNGNFGHRREGGKDFASPRYIFTQLDPVTNSIFREEDDELLTYNHVGNQAVEPTFYAPIIPMILVNGAQGIGTGFSTKIPPYNPKDIVTNLKRLINGKDPIKMVPWFNGFKGTIEKISKSDNVFVIKGKYTIDGNKVHIEDIPIVNGWIEPYEIKMDAKISLSKDDDLKIESIQKNPGNNLINMHITFKGNELQKLYRDGTLDRFLMMTQKLSVTNLNLFNAEGRMTKYESVEDIMRDFYVFRLAMYEKRKEYYLKKLQNDIDIATYKVKFIKECIAKTIVLAQRSIANVTEQLVSKGYPRMSNDHRKDDSNRSYDYLTGMHLLTLTNEKIKELEEKMDNAQALYDEYFNTPIKNIWNKELDEFLVAYDKWIKEWEEEVIMNDKKDTKNGKNKGKSSGKGKSGKGSSTNQDPGRDSRDSETGNDSKKNKSKQKSDMVIKISSKNKKSNGKSK